METTEVRAQDVRLPRRALEALERNEVVAVTHYGRRRHVVLSDERFSLVAPLLEALAAGATVPAELLMTRDDIALERALTDDRDADEAEEALIDSVRRHEP